MKFISLKEYIELLEYKLIVYQDYQDENNFNIPELEELLKNLKQEYLATLN